MNCPNEDRVLEWFHDGDHQFVVATWYEARRYRLNSHCEDCGVTYAKRGHHPGFCPNCGSDYTERLVDVWDDLRDPWMDEDADPADIEECRITNY